MTSYTILWLCLVSMPGIVSDEETWWSKVVDLGDYPFFSTLQASLFTIFPAGNDRNSPPRHQTLCLDTAQLALEKTDSCRMVPIGDPQNWSALMRYRYDMCFWIPQGLGLYPWLSFGFGCEFNLVHSGCHPKSSNWWCFLVELQQAVTQETTVAMS